MLLKLFVTIMAINIFLVFRWPVIAYLKKCKEFIKIKEYKARKRYLGKNLSKVCDTKMEGVK